LLDILCSVKFPERLLLLLLLLLLTS
jgi:hypothetical protein